MGRISAALVVVTVLVGCGGISQHYSVHRYTDSADVSKSDWSDPQEMDRAWRAARVLVPQPGGAPRYTSIGELLETDTDPVRGLYPTVLYLHGCSGIEAHSYRRMSYLARMGFAVIAPDSFAREKYPQSCDPDTNQAGMYYGIWQIRMNDTVYAVARAKELSWVDADNMAMYGLSEGALITAIYYSGKEGRLKARVVEGWTCHSGQQDRRGGIRAPDSEPVLTLVAKYDPWYQNEWTRGNCGEYLNRKNGSRSVVYSKGAIAREHLLFENKAVAELATGFLKKHLDVSP